MEKDKKKKEEPSKGKTLTGEPVTPVELEPNIMEQRKRVAVISFGRLNPPTLGHSKLVDKLVSTARQMNGTPMLFLSHSVDKAKNPLTYDQKIDLAQKAFGKIAQRSPARNIIEVLKSVEKKYDEVIIVVGDDRVREFDVLVNKYNGKEYRFDSVKVVSAGARDPDAQDVTGMSASKMRAAAVSGDFTAFQSGLPTKLKNQAEDIFAMLRKQMGLQESLDEITVQQRIQRSQRMKRIQSRLRAGRKRATARGATASDVKRRSQRRARSQVKRTFSRGGGMSPSEKKRAETMANKRKALITRIAKRLKPKVRRDASARRSPKRESVYIDIHDTQALIENLNHIYNEVFHDG
jgi:hypothetical protein